MLLQDALPHAINKYFTALHAYQQTHVSIADIFKLIAVLRVSV